MSGKSMQSTSTSWPSAWNPDELTKGDGVVGIGKIATIRFHSVASKTDITRYTALGGAQFESGREYTDQIGIRSTCREARRKVYWIMRPNIDMISSSQAAPSKLLDASLLKQLHPHMKGRFEFWADPDVAKRSGLQIGDDAIFKTKGDSLLLAELRAVHGFSGDGGEVMNQISRLSDKHLEAPQVLAQDLMEGVADEEWDD